MSTLPSVNHRVVLNERPGRGPIKSDTFRSDSAPIPEVKDGEVVVKVDYVSIDPAMRGWLDDVRSYLPPVQIGEVMRAGAIGHVVFSKADGFKEGDLVQGTFGWQEYWVGPSKVIQKSETPHGGQDIDHLGLFGVSGMTAYFGIFDIGNLKDGETVLISGAAGSVGLIVTQIALAHPNCKVIAIAGSPDKCASLKKLGCHKVLNYKDEKFKDEFRGIGLLDVYFDNVGGEILDMALAQLKPYARIVMCGAISGYNSPDRYGLQNTVALIPMKATMRGFIAFDYAKRYPEAQAYLADLKAKGKMNYEYYLLEPKESDENGLKRCVEGLEVVFKGKNYGKTLVRISKSSTGKSRL